MKPCEIISDEEIERVHAYANFGDTGKRDVVDSTILKVSCGYHVGHTAMTIIKEHGLIKITPKHRRISVTKMGKKYLFATYKKHSI